MLVLGFPNQGISHRVREHSASLRFEGFGARCGFCFEAFRHGFQVYRFAQGVGLLWVLPVGLRDMIAALTSAAQHLRRPAALLGILLESTVV